MMLTYDEHTAIQEWEKRTGIDFTFVHPPRMMTAHTLTWSLLPANCPTSL